MIKAIQDQEASFNNIRDRIIEDLEIHINVVKKSQNLERLCIILNALASVASKASHTIETDLLGDIDA